MTTQKSWKEESKEAHFNAEGFNYCVAHNEGQECCVESEWFKAYISKVEKEAEERVIEEVRFQASILFPDTEGAIATAAHLVRSLRTKFLSPPKE